MSLAGEVSSSGIGEADEIARLQALLEEKESALRSAAVIGKMLLDEKEEDADVHEAEKEALWRRIQEMARRVMELEREVSDRDERKRLSNGYPAGGALGSVDEEGDEREAGGLSIDIGSGWYGRDANRLPTPGVEARALRAKNEILERQLLHMRESVTEAQLELQAAKKISLRRRRSSISSSGSFLASPSPALRLVKQGSKLGSFRTSFKTMEEARSPSQASLGEDTVSEVLDLENSEVVEEVEEVEDDNIDEEEEEEEESVEWLQEQNRWLREELESKDDLIAALRQQLGGRRHTVTPMARLVSSNGNSSDDGESFLDNLHDAGIAFGREVSVPIKSMVDVPPVSSDDDSAKGEESGWGNPNERSFDDELRARTMSLQEPAGGDYGGADGLFSSGANKEADRWHCDAGEGWGGEQAEAGPVEGKALAGIVHDKEVIQSEWGDPIDETQRTVAVKDPESVPPEHAGEGSALSVIPSRFAPLVTAPKTGGVDAGMTGIAADAASAWASAAPVSTVVDEQTMGDMGQAEAEATKARSTSELRDDGRVATGEIVGRASRVDEPQPQPTSNESHPAAATIASGATPVGPGQVQPLPLVPDRKEGRESTHRPKAVLNRAERKSRMALEKLGLKAVPGVFRVSMRASNGVVFVVKKPDVFKHPTQETYIFFGNAEAESPSGEVREAAHKATAASWDVGYPSQAVKGDGKRAPQCRPDPAEVEAEAFASGVDPADVMTLISLTECSPADACAALRRSGGDVVDASLAIPYLHY